jgi:hypothetical protein
MNWFTGRHRTIAWIVAALCAVLVLGVVARYVVLRVDRDTTEQSAERLTRATNHALVLLRAVRGTRSQADWYNDALEGERDRIRSAAALLHTELDRARAEITSSAIGAYVSGSQANFVAECLTGVSQALNQLSVGDTRAIRSLQAVEAPCRQAGMLT